MRKLGALLRDGKTALFVTCFLFGLLSALFVWGCFKAGLEERPLLLFSLLIVLLLVAAFPAAWLLMRPIETLRNEITDASEGFTSAPVETGGFTQTRAIAEAFNRMSNRTRMQDELRQDFISNVSHELKTPMTSMKVLADSLVTQEDMPADMVKEFLIDIGQEIDRENAIIADLTNLSKLDRKEVQMNYSEVNVGALLEIILKRVRPLAMKRDIEMTLICERPVVASLDEVKMTMAFTNLIDNAVKYNKEHGTVTVTADADHRNCIVSVADTGVGIPEEALPRIYERFYRVDKSRAREIGGTGLGLSLAKTAVALHRGTISAQSSEESGTVFTVTFPLAGRS